MAGLCEGGNESPVRNLIESIGVVLIPPVMSLRAWTAVRLRSACLAMLYRKIIRLSNLGEKSIGELINLFANDGQRIFDMVLFGPMIIGGPVVTVCGVLYILWLLGSWAVLGMLVFLLFYPIQDECVGQRCEWCMGQDVCVLLQYGISRMMGYLRGKTVAVSDQRVCLMTEILTCIRFIKMYAWEKSFTNLLHKTRSKERNFLQKTAYCQSLSISMAPTIPVISAIVTFLAHISAGNNLTAAQAFPLICYLLQLPAICCLEYGSKIRKGCRALLRVQVADLSMHVGVNAALTVGTNRYFI
ncbi:hypothetical protein ANN_05669 [Periplaneta americana]|uniref:ABC transmembrane type-1 domain-containing protein n=1 Tax=Periplaneta americana TaxID=6978 RepID=A0ABQ8TDJ7_PERAM|nr:hypothetical protein ANN_05669 [Periplaneta americana]